MKHVFLLLICTFLFIPIQTLEIEFIAHNITSDFFQVNTVFPADINADGFDDILACGTAVNGEISWWENQQGESFLRHVITENFDARSVKALDLDYDQDLDIIACSVWSSTIKIWLNDGQENFTEEIIVDADFAGAHTVDVKDVDGDGIHDVLCAGFDIFNDEGEIAWWKNIGDLEFSEKQLISDHFQHAPFVFGQYINDDENLDIVACGEILGDVLWWENTGDGYFTEHIIDSTFHYAHTVFARDLDQDEDMDILGSACVGSQFAWWENDGEENFTKHVVENAPGALWLDTCDLDDDGDLDLLGAAQGLSAPVWYENDGNQDFTRHQLPGFCQGGFCAVTADFDRDGDKDVCCAGWNSNKISWWESRLYEVDFEAAPLTGHYPLQVEFCDLSDLPDPVTAWYWDFDGDGETDSNEQEPAWVYSDPGDYSVTLTVETEFTSKSTTKENFIHVFNGHSALEYNGSSSFVYCNPQPELNLTEAFTIEAWIRPQTWSGNYDRICDKGTLSLSISENFPLFNEHCLILQIEHTDGTISRAFTAENSIQLDVWQHVAVTYNGSNDVKFWINGILSETDYNGEPAGEITDNEDDLLIIGNSESGTLTFRGTIDELRIWGTARSYQEIISTMFNYLTGDEPDLIASWTFNEGNGDTFACISPEIEPGLIFDADWVQGYELIQVSVEPDPIIPAGNSDLNVYPNPFNPEMNIEFYLPERTAVRIAVFNLKGELVKELLDENRDSGRYLINWDARNFQSGIYFTRLTTERGSITRKAVMIK